VGGGLNDRKLNINRILGILKFRNFILCWEYYTQKIHAITQPSKCSIFWYFTFSAVHLASLLSPCLQLLYSYRRMLIVKGTMRRTAKEFLLIGVIMFTYGNNIHFRHSREIFWLLNHRLFINLKRRYSVSIFPLCPHPPLCSPLIPFINYSSS